MGQKPAPVSARTTQKAKDEALFQDQPEQEDAPPADTVSEPSEAQNLSFDTDFKFRTDLFRLKTAKMKKKFIFADDNGDTEENFRPVDHEHFFHTYDSNGKELNQCNAVGGHFHEMKVKDNGPGKAPTVTCSGPKMYKYVKQKGTQKPKRIIVDATDGDDHHTHQIVYEKSTNMRPRIINSDSVKFLNAETAKVAPPAGINEGV